MKRIYVLGTLMGLGMMSFVLAGCPTNGGGGGGGNGGGNGGGGNGGGNGGQADVYINEFAAHVSRSIVDADGDLSDWIELYNAGDGTANLAGWGISDDEARPFKWIFPEVQIPQGGYLLVFASGKDRAPSGGGGELHTNFSLSRNGEYLGLVDSEGSPIADSIFSPAYPPQYVDLVYGRTGGSAEFQYLNQPTPGAPNTLGGAFSDVIVFSAGRGHYDAPLELTLTAAQPGVELMYTLDGSTPSPSNGTAYAAPLELAATAAVRVAAVRDDTTLSPVFTHTYAIAESAARRSLPMLSLAGDPGETFYEPNGIMAIVGGRYEPSDWYDVWVPETDSDYNNALGRGSDFERPVSLEIVDGARSDTYQGDCGIRVQASNFHRARLFRADDWTGCPADNVNYAKFSFRLIFRGSYGPTHLDYGLMPLRPGARQEQVILRGGQSDMCDPFIHDELSRRLFHEMGHVSSVGSLASLYINGDYKGVYNPAERIDQSFLRDRYDSGESWDVITQGSDVRDGDDEAWQAFLDFVRAIDMSVESNYILAQQSMDVDNFIDYLILQLYTNNADWPNNGWIAARERSLLGRWQFYVWNSEFAFLPWNMDLVGFDAYPQPDGQGLNGEETEIAWIYRSLKASAAFRARFAQRVEFHFGGGGALAPHNVLARYEELWSDASGALPGINTYIRDGFVPTREAILRAALQEEGLLP